MQELSIKTQENSSIDSLCRIERLREHVHSIYINRIDETGDERVYLIEGPERALLVDAGFGIGNLKGLVGDLIGQKPLMAAVTHSHSSHASGSTQFESCYCHEYEAASLRNKLGPRFNIIPVPDGYVFDLGGGFEAELIWNPGHTAGHAVFLDKRDRLLFSGDGVGTVIEIGRGSAFTTVEAYRKELLKLSERMGEFDYIYPARGTCGLKSLVIPAILQSADDILRDPTAYDESYEDSEGPMMIKLVRGLGAIIYPQGSVYKEYEG